jgi:hypothetical protein
MEILPLPEEITTSKTKKIQPKKKVMLIDGLSSIMNEDYFLSDTIPRYLTKYIEEGYNVWIVIREQENTEPWNLLKVSTFLRENILLLTDFDLFGLLNLTNQETSMVVTNYPENKSLYNICGKVYTNEEIFHLEIFPQIKLADFLFCFGFSEEKFFSFCEESNLIGIVNNKTIHDKDELNKTNGMAFWVDKEKSWRDQMNDFNEFANICVQRKLFIPKHDKTLLGIIYQGKDKFIALESELPLLYV